MTSFRHLLSLLLVATAISATPFQINTSPITLPLAVQMKAAGGPAALLQKDRARAKAFIERGNAKAQGKSLADIPFPVTDVGQIYSADVEIGAGKYTLIVDTGSSNTWCGADPSNAYAPGPNSTDTGNPVGLLYGSGDFQGEEFVDTMTLGSATFTQSIGAATTATGFTGFDGILGVGPDILTTASTPTNETIPTVTDNLKSQGLIPAVAIGVSFSPSVSADSQNGAISFGGPDDSHFMGDISYTPVTQTAPATFYWGINQAITYGDTNTPLMSMTAGIVDTGTTLTVIPSDAFQTYVQLTGATMDENTGLLTIDDPSKLQSLFFNIGNGTFEFTANAQIFPRDLNTVIGLPSNQTFLVIADMGTPTGEGLDFVNGYTFLQRFYSVFDTDNQRVGFAMTNHTHDTTN